MNPAIAGLDHTVIAVRDLNAAHETYSRMGFTLTKRGHHSTGSSNHNIMLGGDYFELLRVPQPNPLQAYFYEFTRSGEGLAALALAANDSVKARAHLEAQGFEPSATLSFSRAVDEAGVKGTARFALTNLANKATPGAQVFLCQHFTRELVWARPLMKHANGALSIAAVAFVTDAVAATAGAYGLIFSTWPERIDEGLKLATGQAPLAFCTPQSLQARLAGVELPMRRGTHLAALFLRVRDRLACAKLLREAGFEPKRMQDGSFALDASAAHGVTLVFG
jgi:catechol 2,3-dioxygenase-like lactoylglutathione lyase family enzyme